jgi:pSer/pThr/pTyr-binding forkhead associated (FHA) protein
VDRAPDHGGTPRLVVTGSDRLAGTAFALDRERLLVGRDDAAEVWLDSPYVSRRHAVIDRTGASVTVTDLGSSGGTTVNGRPAPSPIELRDGDVLCFATVTARFESGRTAPEMTVPVPPSFRREPSPRVDYNVEGQYAGQVNNVAGNQFNHYQQFNQARDNFLREIAAGRSRARRLIWLGLFLTVAGGGTYLLTVLHTAGQIDSLLQTGADNPDVDPSPPRLFGPQVAGVSVGLVGYAVAALGCLLMVVGLVLHVVATSRRKQTYAATPYLPGPVPWSAPPNQMR